MGDTHDLTGGYAPQKCAHCEMQFGTWHLCDAIRTVKPFGEMVLVVVLPRPNVSKAGIILTNDEVLGREDHGVLVRCGARVPPEVHDECMRIVKFKPYDVRMVLDVDGAHTTNSAHAKAGSQAILHYESIIGIVE